MGENVANWLNELRSNSVLGTKIFLIGNKSDLENKREVSTQEAKRFKEENNIDFFVETSARSGENSTKVFIEAAKNLHYDYLTNPPSRSMSMASRASSVNKKYVPNADLNTDEGKNEDSSSG